ncbi:uroporphyrinogen-III synthase [Amnibacterium flavum]|uniref:Uroporphyrinogen-III synthase n=1 Tax=Amnibacterium flavum TaxID=2173173 RepID=A0A2V1HYG1_9MICO|nr:uroporphyrinogen-III synthase [Amnibacterium flavum]PVZ95524.1 uroporphyrinogen III synthase [Amnibacterium flavum]
MTRARPLAGWKVLVPRGGPWGHGVAADLRLRGASPVVAPMINFASTDDSPTLERALADLGSGVFDWVSVTSATTVDVLSSHRATIPESTRVAAVGETTAAALLAAGYRVDFVPSRDNSAAGLLAEWEEVAGSGSTQRILALRSDIAKPVLTDGLRAIGHDVDSVIAYRTVGVPVDPSVVANVAAGAFQAILVTSGSVAGQIHEQFGDIPESTLVACIGPRTASDARAVGLRVDLVASDRSVSSLIDSLIEVAARRETKDGEDW